jgi:hypothetical protein
MDAKMRLAIPGLVLAGLVAAAQPTAAQSSLRMTIGGGFGGNASVGDHFDTNGPGWAAQTHLGLSSASLPVGFQVEFFFSSLAKDRTTFEQAPAVRVSAGTLTLELPVVSDSRGGGLFVAAGGGLYRFSSEAPGGIVATTSSNETGVVAGLAYRRVLSALDVGITGRIHNIFTEDEHARLLSGLVTVHVPILGR